jgi:hypothetical protein
MYHSAALESFYPKITTLKGLKAGLGLKFSEI